MTALMTQATQRYSEHTIDVSIRGKKAKTTVCRAGSRNSRGCTISQNTNRATMLTKQDTRNLLKTVNKTHALSLFDV